MKHQLPPCLVPGLAGILLLGPIATADVNPFESERTDKLTVVSPDESASLTVTLEEFEIEKLRRVEDREGNVREAWLGSRRLPVDLLWRRPTLISSFELRIDGQRVEVPARFWNDLAGLSLEKLIINRPVKTEEDEWELEEFVRQLPGPRVVRSADGGTVLVTWVRPEE